MFWLIVIVGIVVLIAVFGLGPREKELPPPNSPGEAARRAQSNLERAVRQVDKAVDEIDRKAAEHHARIMEETRQGMSSLGRDLMEREVILRAAFNHAQSIKNIEERIHGHSSGTIGGTLHAGLPGENLSYLTSYDMFESFRFYSIPYLCHFTRVENLPSILTHGIVPRAECPGKGIEPVVNDLQRLDGRPDTNSLSVGHPNYRMLWKYRQEHPEADWVVLAINPATLRKGSYIYCPHNAADKRVTGTKSIHKGDALSFWQMFADNRCSHNIWEPADDQAEILAAGTINPSFVTGIFFLSDKSMIRCRELCGDRAVFNAGASEAIFASRFHVTDLAGPAKIAGAFQVTVNEIAEKVWSDRHLARNLEKPIGKIAKAVRCENDRVSLPKKLG